MTAWSSQSFDVIVIGSGPGGASVATELSRQGKKVLILEWGSGAVIKGNMLQTTEMALIPGRGLFFTPELLSLVRVVTMEVAQSGLMPLPSNPIMRFSENMVLT